MKKLYNKLNWGIKLSLLIAFTILPSFIEGNENDVNPLLQYTISMDDPGNHLFHVTLDCKGLKWDTIDFKLPQWMPGYYQIMNYSGEVKNFYVFNLNGKTIPVANPSKNTWRILSGNNSSFKISYDIYADKKFVANNYLDSTHGYIVPAATFMFINGHLDIPVSLKSPVEL